MGREYLVTWADYAGPNVYRCTGATAAMELLAFLSGFKPKGPALFLRQGKEVRL